MACLQRSAAPALIRMNASLWEGLRMASVSDWKVPLNLQPSPADYAFDLETAINTVVGLRATVPEDAFTAQVIGTERAGHGVVIADSGLVLTIGYLITEAQAI
jgi:hypothetical protein